MAKVDLLVDVMMIIEADLNILGSESIENSFSKCGLRGGEWYRAIVRRQYGLTYILQNDMLKS